MLRWMKRALVGFCGLLILAALAGATYQWLATRRDLEATSPPGRLVDVGGHRHHMWCTGTGAPPAILETGLGGSTADWGFVQPEVAQFTRLCSYDRAGMGYSDPGPSPRTAKRNANELAELLSRTGIAEPPILVGASIGGFTLRVFASERSRQVAGLVLGDASHENDTHESPSIAKFVPILSSFGLLRLFDVSFGFSLESLAPSVRAFQKATAFRSAGYRAAADEIMHIEQTVEEVRATRRKLTIPLAVVTGARDANAQWRALQRDLVMLSEHGCQIAAEQSGHAVQVNQPQIVVSAIRVMVNTARGLNAVSLREPAP